MVSNQELQKNIPFFVTGGKPDHKCGICAYRMGENGCALVEGSISFAHGSCSLWAEGKEEAKKAMPMRLTKDEADYVETSGKIQCGTCRLFKSGKCELWSGDPVKETDCCAMWCKETNSIQWAKSRINE